MENESKMSTTEWIKVRDMYQQLVDMYGDQLPSHIFEPRRFQYYVNLLNWHNRLSKPPVDI